MARLTGGTVTERIAGWTGGIRESTEPVFSTRDGGVALRAAENAWHENRQLERRGGTRAAASYTTGRLLVGVTPFSQTGLIAITHQGTTHRAHAHGADGSFALPTGGAGTEADSTTNLGSGWNGASVGVPVGAELFEAVYLADDSPIASRRPLQKLALSGGSLVATTPTYQLGAGPAAAAKFAGVEVFASVVFGWGYGSEDNPDEPHTMRHSFLGRDPAAADGFDPDAYATIGAQGQPVRAAKAGQGVLLVAKEAELYRISGSGSALPGWQFAIQQVDASLGAGCVNARCLVYAEGWWYGLGRDGPWRCDGARVEVLRSNRGSSWRGIGSLDSAFVVHHPRRRAVLFGLEESASTLTGSGASVLWAWDLEENCWGPNHRLPTRIRAAAAIAPSGVVVPTTPSAVTQVLEQGAFRETSLQLRWVNGLPNQPTEVWASTSSTGNQLLATVGAGISGIVLTGLTAGTEYSVTLRHVGAIETPFTNAVSAYTRPNAPRLAMAYRGLDGLNHAYQITTNVAGLSGYVESTNAIFLPFADDLPNLPQGTTRRSRAQYPLGPNGVVSYPGGPLVSWREPLTADAYLYQATWPESVAYSVVATANARWPFDGNLLAANGPVLIAPVPTQVVDLDAWQGTSITIQLTPYTGRIGTVDVLYRKFGTVNYTTSTTIPVTASTLPLTHTITGLEAGERYEVVTRLNTTDITAQQITLVPPVVMYTAIPAPTATIATAGAGTPVTNITVTPPGGKAGYDVHVANASGSFDALYTGVASTATTYQSTSGTCGRADRYIVRARRAEWPSGLEWSPAVVLDIVNPCVIA